MARKDDGGSLGHGGSSGNTGNDNGQSENTDGEFHGKYPFENSD
jgi:hypothetical protein